MISPEILRRFPVFVGFSNSQLKALAMNAEETEFHTATILFEDGTAADKLFLLVDGSIDLLMKSEDGLNPSTRRIFSVGEINPGEIFGISSLLEPYQYSLTARSAGPCNLIEFNGAALREMIQEDVQFANQIMHQLAKTLIQRLYETRVQLASAWA